MFIQEFDLKALLICDLAIGKGDNLPHLVVHVRIRDGQAKSGKFFGDYAKAFPGVSAQRFQSVNHPHLLLGYGELQGLHTPIWAIAAVFAPIREFNGYFIHS